MTPSRGQRDVKTKCETGLWCEKWTRLYLSDSVRFHSVVLFQATASAEHSQALLELIKVSWIRSCAYNSVPLKRC